MRIQTVLDVGSGDAWFANALVKSLPHDAQVTCWDTGYDEVVKSELVRNMDPRVHLVCDQPREAFDAVLMLDVVEHVSDDVAFLRRVVTENMTAGSMLVFSVPAWPLLWSSHDEHLRHVRRYSPNQAALLLRQADLRVVQSGGLFHSLVMPRLAQILLERLSPRWRPAKPRSTWSGGAALTAAVQKALEADNLASRLASRAGIDLPGLSWWARCEKR